MSNTNAATSNATLTPEARGIVAAGKATATDLQQAQAIANAMGAAFSTKKLQAALCYLAGIAEGKHLERQRRASATPQHYAEDTGDAIDFAEAESVALEKAIVLLNDVIDFLDPLCVAVKRKEWERAFYKANDVNPALQKAFILADILHDIDAKTDAFLKTVFSDQ